MAEHQFGLMMALEDIADDAWMITGFSIAELRTYRRPPKGVKEIVKAFFCLLGYEKRFIKTWAQLRFLLGYWLKVTSRYRLTRIEPGELEYEHAMMARAIIGGARV